YVIIAAPVCSKCVRCSDSNGGWLITRRMNEPVDLFPGAVFAVVSSGSNDHDSRVNQAAHCAAHWIVLVRVYCEASKAELDDTDVVGCAPGHYPIEGAQQRRHCPLAL